MSQNTPIETINDLERQLANELVSQGDSSTKRKKVIRQKFKYKKAHESVSLEKGQLISELKKKYPGIENYLKEEKKKSLSWDDREILKSFRKCRKVFGDNLSLELLMYLHQSFLKEKELPPFSSSAARDRIYYLILFDIYFKEFEKFYDQNIHKEEKDSSRKEKTDNNQECNPVQPVGIDLNSERSFSPERFSLPSDDDDLWTSSFEEGLSS